MFFILKILSSGKGCRQGSRRQMKVAALMSDTTQRWRQAWINKLSNYLIMIVGNNKICSIIWFPWRSLCRADWHTEVHSFPKGPRTPWYLLKDTKNPVEKWLRKIWDIPWKFINYAFLLRKDPHIKTIYLKSNIFKLKFSAKWS